MKNQKLFALSAVSLLALGAQLVVPMGANADPYKLGVQDSTFVPSTGNYEYPAPQAVTPTQPLKANARSNALQGGNQQNYTPPPPPRRPPIQAQVQKVVSLPPGYLGLWHVSGQRSSVETASPDFQQTAMTAFAPQTNDNWEISGNPQSGYTMANGPMNTPFIVDRIGPDGTAFIRYQHPIGKTMAQEAVVLTLTNGGRSFNGLERISIVKEGEPPRAKVTYQLNGMRQR